MSDRLLVATRKGLFDIHHANGAWEIGRVAFLAENVSMVACDPRDGALYAGLNHGHFGVKLHRSRDGGETWQEIAVPAYPEGETIKRHAMAPDGDDVPATLELIWSIEPGGADRPGRLWVGTIPGGLFRSDDHGDSWELVRSLWDREERKAWFGGGFDHGGIHSILVDPRDSDCVTVGISCGGVWRTADAGGSWTHLGQGLEADYMPPEQRGDLNVQDPHQLVMCPADPDVMWIQHHNGIFRSTDGARTWTRSREVKPSAFGFAVAAHPADPRTAWFVPAQKDEHRVPVEARVVVTRTRDGGKTFDILSEGLPQKHAYDLTFRHALAVDPRGERLAFGTTTGSLWVSEDAGDAWTTVSNHLPPIYAVRFASSSAAG